MRARFGGDGLGLDGVVFVGADGLTVIRVFDVQPFTLFAPLVDHAIPSRSVPRPPLIPTAVQQLIRAQFHSCTSTSMTPLDSGANRANTSSDRSSSVGSPCRSTHQQGAMSRTASPFTVTVEPRPPATRSAGPAAAQRQSEPVADH